MWKDFIPFQLELIVIYAAGNFRMAIFMASFQGPLKQSKIKIEILLILLFTLNRKK
jgi:hypothetical protein